MWINQNARVVVHKVFGAISVFQYGVREIFHRMGSYVAWIDYYFQLRTAAFKAYCAIWVRRSNFYH